MLFLRITLCAFYLISHYGAGLPLNRYGSGAYAVDQRFSLYDAASDDQKFKLVTVNNKQRIAMNGNTSLGLNVYRSGDNPCTLYTLLSNDNDSQVSIEACSEGVSDCYYIYFVGKLSIISNLTMLRTVQTRFISCLYLEA